MVTQPDERSKYRDAITAEGGDDERPQQPSSAEWRKMIEAAPVPTPVVASDFLRSFGTFSSPCVVRCFDGHDYVIKGVSPTGAVVMGLPLTTERAVAVLGRHLGAPIPEPAFVDFSALWAVEPHLQRFGPVLAHGSRMISNVRDEKPPAPQSGSTLRNQRAYASLAVLYGWFVSNDEQWLVTIDQDADVYSHDHGHFLPAGPAWSSASLATAPDPIPHSLFAPFSSKADLEETARRLANVSDVAIATALAQPSEWDVPVSERVSLGQYLSRRRDKMVAVLSA